jgi:CubicO group peptidase (beta-lactamase class C family)
MRSIYLFLLLLGLAFLPLHAETPKARNSKICELAAENHIPGLAVATFENGQRTDVVCGTRDVAMELPVTRQTVFEAASVGKPLFAYAVLKLVAQGQLKLDAPLLGYLGNTYVHRQDPFRQIGSQDEVTDPRFQHITARMVLSHTTGLPNWQRKGPLTFTGEAGHWQYSGEAFTLLQRAIEKITGQSLEEWMHQTIFEPLGMHHSSFVWKPEYQPNFALGFYEDGKQLRPDDLTNFKYPLAAATLYTTLDDYSRFVNVLLGGDSITREMFGKQVTVNASYGLSWGLGIGIADNDGKLSYFHYGDDPGFKALVLVQPAQKKAFLMLTNSDNGEKAERPIVIESLGSRPRALDAPELWH